MKKNNLLILSLSALCATVAYAFDIDIMNIEMVGEAEVTVYQLDDVECLTFNSYSREMTINKSDGDSETLSIDDINRIIFGDYIAETDDDTESGDDGDATTELDPDIQASSVLIYGTDAVHVAYADGIKGVTIVSVNGAQVFAQRYNAQPTEVVADIVLAKGVYVVTVETQGKRISQKVRIK